MYFNFQQNRVSRSVKKSVHTNLFAKNHELQLATRNLNFKPKLLLDMHYSFSDIQAEFEINRPIGF